MFLGGIVWFALAAALFARSDRLAEQFLSALPAEQGRALLPNRWTLFGPFRYQFAKDRLLGVISTDPDVEQRRQRAARWRRWWMPVSFALAVPCITSGVALQTIGIGIDQLPPSDAEIIALGFTGAVVWIAGVILRQPTK